jgi:transposase
MGLQQRQIAGSCAIAQSTVHEYLKAAAQAGVSWPLPAEWNEQQLEGALSRKPRSGAPAPQVALPDFPAIRKQLQTRAATSQSACSTVVTSPPPSG